VRLDVLLHELRLFKSRNQALAAIEQGHVKLHGRAVKPSHAVRPGDRITLSSPRGSRTLELVELPSRSLRKDEAHRLYREVGDDEATGGGSSGIGC
jgi:ribosome-associated heat shock protein Hsp15